MICLFKLRQKKKNIKAYSTIEIFKPILESCQNIFKNRGFMCFICQNMFMGNGNKEINTLFFYLLKCISEQISYFK